MSIAYNGKHEICFWKENYTGTGYYIENPKFTWVDFHLVPLSRPSVSAPKPNFVITSIPNSSSRINITDYMPGGLTYESRSGEWQFVIDHDQWSNWTTTHYELGEYFNGSKMLVSLDDNRSYIYEGRVNLSGFESGDAYSTVTIAYDFDADPISDFSDIRFRVRFMSQYGQIFKEELMTYNSTPYYYGTVPSEGGLRFKRWQPYINKVTRNIDYIAEYR